MEYVFHFLYSALEALSICCILSLLRKDYCRPVKILIMICVVAGFTTILDIAKIDINVGVNILLIAVVLKFLFNLKALEILFDALCGAMAIIAIEMITTYLISFVQPQFLESEAKMLIYLSTLAIFFLVILKITKGKSQLQKYYIKYQKGIWIVCLNFFFIQIAQMYNWNQTNRIDISLIILALIAITANLILAFKLVKNQQQKEELQNQQQLMKLKEEFLQQMAAEQHDFAKHLQAIQSLLTACKDTEQINEVRSYVNELAKTRDSKSKVAYVGDGVLSAFLSGKQSEAEAQNINFSILVKNPIPKFPCSKTELIEIIGNLIDNAFEAVVELDEKLRKVFFEVGEENQHIFIQTMNCLPERSIEPSRMVIKGFSTKNGSLRGYGLYNVKSLIEQYNGKLEIQMNEEVIVMKILFK